MTTFNDMGAKPIIPIPSGVIKGPADADHYRVKVGRWGDRWYTDPLPGCELADASDSNYPSMSFIKKASGSDWTFVALKRVALALRDNPKALDGLDYEACKDRLSSINKLDLGRAMRRGTNVHTYIEMGLRGHGIKYVVNAQEDGAEYLPAVRGFFDTYQPKLVAAEVVCINRTLNGVGYGTTADAVVEIDGKNYWVDWKSRSADSSHGCYPEEAGQIGCGAKADYMIVQGEHGPVRQAPTQVEGGLIVSIKPDGVRLYPVDIDRAWSHWQNLHAWWVARREETVSIGKPWPPRAVIEQTDGDILLGLIDQAASNDELTTLWKQHQQEWTPAHTDAAKKRKTVLWVAA
ncbi:MAG: hypothetical protein NVSMB60_30230 [Mycobacterium sp.]